MGSEVVYQIPAIRTLFDGVWFDSDLEARHAHVFNQLGNPWLREPKDICGSGWLPDLLLVGTRILVETKPIRERHVGLCDRLTSIAFPRGYAVMLLGDGPIAVNNEATLGWLAAENEPWDRVVIAYDTHRGTFRWETRKRVGPGYSVMTPEGFGPMWAASRRATEPQVVAPEMELLQIDAALKFTRDPSQRTDLLKRRYILEWGRQKKVT